MNYIHKDLASGRWEQLSISEQMANIGSDVERAMKWKKEGNNRYFEQAFDRLLELIDLTLADPKNSKRLKEIARVREALVDYLIFDNIYGTNDEFWTKYFYDFNYAARVNNYH